ncbi:MAG: hypothetical protein OXB86_04930, partial [Bdellovibrionales bacterium]|nr:hypothetical protein [Bdellovibrionales bacterium]
RIQMLNKLSMLLLSLFLGLVLNVGAQETGSDTAEALKPSSNIIEASPCVSDSKANSKYQYCTAQVENFSEYCTRQSSTTHHFCLSIAKTAQEKAQCITELQKRTDSCEKQYSEDSAICKEKVMACAGGIQRFNSDTDTDTDTEAIFLCISKSRTEPKYQYCENQADDFAKYCVNQAHATRNFCLSIAKTGPEEEQCIMKLNNSHNSCGVQYSKDVAKCEESLMACVENSTDKNQSDALKHLEIVKQCMNDDTVKKKLHDCIDKADDNEDRCTDRADIAENLCLKNADIEEEEDKCKDKADVAHNKCGDEYDIEFDYCEKENLLKDVTVCVEMATTADTQNSQ